MTARPKIAAITTIYHQYAHTQHIVDRFLEGYGWNGRHHRPPKAGLRFKQYDSTPTSRLGELPKGVGIPVGSNVPLKKANNSGRNLSHADHSSRKSLPKTF